MVMQGISTSYQEWKITAEEVSQLVGILQSKRLQAKASDCLEAVTLILVYFSYLLVYFKYLYT